MATTPSDTEAMLSARLAAQVLAALLGTGLRQARQVIDSGLAGPPRVERGVHLYRESAIAALAGRPVIDVDPPDPAWSALLVLRRAVPASLDWDERIDALSGGWDMPVTALVPIGPALATGPVVALGCTAGFITTVALVIDARKVGRGRNRTQLDLAAPPTSLERLSDQRLPGRPGRAWSWHAPRGTRQVSSHAAA